MDRPTCKTCPYWREGLIVLESDEGECRRTIREGLPKHEQLAVKRPAVLATTYSYWCGEHPEFTAWIEANKKGEASE